MARDGHGGSETLVEIHALPKFETAPTEAGERPPTKFTDAQVSLIEERLAGPRDEILSKASPILPDLARAFLEHLRNRPVTVSNAYASELRCQARSAGDSICGIYFWTKAPSEYCRIGLTLVRGALAFSSDPASDAHVTCYRFSE